MPLCSPIGVIAVPFYEMKLLWVGEPLTEAFAASAENIHAFDPSLDF